MWMSIISQIMKKLSFVLCYTNLEPEIARTQGSFKIWTQNLSFIEEKLEPWRFTSFSGVAELDTPALYLEPFGQTLLIHVQPREENHGVTLNIIDSTVEH